MKIYQLKRKKKVNQKKKIIVKTKIWLQVVVQNQKKGNIVIDHQKIVQAKKKVEVYKQKKQQRKLEKQNNTPGV
jgi:adenine deaminase